MSTLTKVYYSIEMGYSEQLNLISKLIFVNT